jgi:hypothetical protein
MADEPIVKPGYKTTEFWLTAAADLLALLMVSGIFDGHTDSIWTKIVGGAVAMLATMGYTSSRSKAKSGQ